MLATKIQAGRSFLLFLSLALSLTGCTPPGPRALLEGRRLLERGQDAQAIEKFQVATSLLSTNAQAWNYLGVAYHRVGQITNAAAAYQRALALDRHLVEARYNLGCLWLEQSERNPENPKLLEAAKSEFTAYTLLRGTAVEGWLKLGAVQLRGREAAAAEKSFREALRLSPRNAEACNGLGMAQLLRSRPREAAQWFQQALQYQGDYRPALLNLATVLYQHLNDRPGAAQQYRAYLALQPRPDDADAVAALVKTLEPVALPISMPAPPATNAIAVTQTPAALPVPKTTTASVARATAPSRTSAPPAAVKPAPAIPAVANIPAEEVRVPPEPIVKAASKTPVVVTSPAPATVEETARPVAADSSPPPPGSPVGKPAKPGLLARLNPVRLLRSEPKPELRPTPLPGDQRVVDPGLSSVSSSAASGSSSPTNEAGSPLPDAPGEGTRYQYAAPVKPVAGNRREAERAFAQAQQLQRANRLAEAMQSYRQATMADPAFFEAYYGLGLAAYEARSYRQSLAAWESALAIQPESADARFNFALALKAANHPLDAARELERILAAKPDETRAHLILGNLYAEPLKNVNRARRHYQKVLELDPRHPQATAIRYWLVAHPGS